MKLVFRKKLPKDKYLNRFTEKIMKSASFDNLKNNLDKL